MRTNDTNLLFAINNANTRFLIFEQFDCIAFVILFLIVVLSGIIYTEFVKNMNTLFETRKFKKKIYLCFIEN